MLIFTNHSHGIYSRFLKTIVVFSLVFFFSLLKISAQVVFQSHSYSGGTDTEAIVNQPTGLQEGDLMIVVICTDNGSDVSITAPNDWVLIESTNFLAQYGMTSFYKIANNSESVDYTFTFDNTVGFVITNARFSGVHQTFPIDISGGLSGIFTNAISPSITPGNLGTLVLSIHGKRSNVGMAADPNTNFHFQDFGDNSSILLTSFEHPSASPTNIRTATGGGLFAWAAQQIAIRPSAIINQETFNVTDNFTVPPGVHSITVEAWGGGGGTMDLGNARRGGGGGGAYAKSTFAVTQGSTYDVIVGSGGLPGDPANNGGDSYFDMGSNVLAKGGTGGTNNGGVGGQASASVAIGSNPMKFSGGNGGNRSNILNAGGGGGGSAFRLIAGFNGINGIFNTGGLGGLGIGNGGNGGNNNGSGQDGNFPGGGGGGKGTNGSAGAGADGQVVITWASPEGCVPPFFTSCPENLTLETSIDDCIAIADYEVAAIGIPVPELNYQFDGPTNESGSGNGIGTELQLGSYNVTITSANECNPVATCEFTIEVVDNQKPEIICPDDFVINLDECTCEANVEFNVSGYDNCDFSLDYSHPSGSDFPVGETEVTVTATDNAQNSESCSFLVNIIESPRITLVGNGLIIENGDNTPKASHHTLMGSVGIISSISRTFTIQNNGCSTLELTGTPTVQISGVDAEYFTVSSQPADISISNCDEITFEITYLGSEPFGYRQATITIENNYEQFDFDVAAATSPAIIKVRGNYVDIPNGDYTPQSNDFTDFGAVAYNSNKTRLFRIHNVGSQNLLLNGVPKVILSGPGAANFNVSVQPLSPITPSQNRTFSVRFNGGLPGEYVATVSIENNDLGANPYTFDILATVLLPNMQVRGNGIVIANGDDIPVISNNTDFGFVNIGNNKINSFIVHNLGPGGLGLTGSPRVQLSGADASQFSIITQPAANINSGGTSLLRIRYAPSSGGPHFATVVIPNIDPLKNPYTYAITGSTPNFIPDDPYLYLFNPPNGNNPKDQLTSLKTYPNPATTKLYIESPILDLNLNLYIIDLLGNTILTHESNGGNIELDIKHLPSGYYIIKTDNPQILPANFIIAK